MENNMELHVLLIEDSVDDMTQLLRDLPDIFKANNIEVTLDPKSTFEDGIAAIKNPHVRYDLVISDTYRGNHSNRDAAVLASISEHRNGKFCPIIVCSSGDCPADFEETAFVKWADKADHRNLDASINLILKLGIPQTAKKLHQELDQSAGKFLWGFLESNWQDLNEKFEVTQELLERIIRKRAALKISDLTPGEYSALDNRYGLEYYIYPCLEHQYYSLGDIIQKKNNSSDLRVIITPHCHLITQPGQTTPRAEFVLTIKTVSAATILGEKITNLRGQDTSAQHEKLRKWATSPAQTEKKPTGRHWYLPGFLKIPHSFCDFLQIESIPYGELDTNYDTLGTLSAPYAEALQQCFSSFYGSVGIPLIDPKSIANLIN